MAAALEPLRGVADEIVVAADSRVGAGDLAAYGELADKLFRIEFAPPVDRSHGWLMSRCRGDWIFLIDGDEIPSAALVEELPRLVESRDVVQYRVPRRWLYPDRHRWLTGSPWAPDYQIRLFRRDPAILRAPGHLHRHVEPAFPARYLETPIYHHVLVSLTLAERRVKVDEYERLKPNGVPQPDNAAYYLPELRDGLATAPVPAEDAPLLAAAFREARDVGANGPVPLVGREEIDLLWALRPLGESAYRARLTPLTNGVALGAGSATEIPVRVENLGDALWPWGDFDPPIRLTYKWLDGAGREVVEDGVRTLLPADVAPGSTSVVPLAVTAPSQPGRHVLAIDLVHEHVRWFGCRAELEVEVT